MLYLVNFPLPLIYYIHIIGKIKKKQYLLQNLSYYVSENLYFLYFHL